MAFFRVGLPGLEPGTSSLSVPHPQCQPVLARPEIWPFCSIFTCVEHLLCPLRTGLCRPGCSTGCSTWVVYVSLLDQVLEGQPHPPVPLGHADNQPEVALYQFFAGSLVSGTYPPGERCLLLGTQQPASPDPRQVDGEKLWSFRFLPPRCASLTRLLSFGDGCGGHENITYSLARRCCLWALHARPQRPRARRKGDRRLLPAVTAPGPSRRACASLCHTTSPCSSSPT